jgi:hypothetical protein
MSQYKNFLIGDPLKDFLQLTNPLPPKPKLHLFPSHAASLRNSFQSTFTKTSTFKSEIPLRQQLETHDAVFDCKLGEQFVPCVSTSFTHPSVFRAEVYVIWFDITSILKQNQQYYQVKFAQYKDYLYNVQGFKTVSFVHICKEHTSMFTLWKPSSVALLIEECKIWLTSVTYYKDTWTSDPPSNPFLFPNLALRIEDEYTSIREKLAWNCKEVSLLYFIGVATRKILHNKKIYSLDHPGLLTVLSTIPYISAEILAVQTKMLSNMFKEMMVEVPCWVSNVGYQNFQNYVYVDIETSLDGANTIINLIGVVFYNGLKWIYQSFVSRDSSCRNQFQTFAEDHREKTFVHFTAADKVIFNETHKTLDLHQGIHNEYLGKEHMQQLCLHNFRLKTIYKQICKRCNFINLYEDCKIKGGLQALEECNAYRLGDPNACMISVIRYNRVDCIALAAFHMYREQCFVATFKDMLTKC